MAGTPAFDQDRFRFRYDDDDLDNATWMADLNTNVTWVANQNIRIRIAIQETADVRTSNEQFYLGYSLNGAAYTYGSPYSYYSSPYFADEDQDDTQRLGTGQTFKGSGANESLYIGNGGWIDFSGSDEYELEFCFRFPVAAQVGDYIDIHLLRYNGSTYVPIDSYSVTPRVTIAGTEEASTSCYLSGGINVNDDTPAYMVGDYARGQQHCMLEGFRDGYSAKKIWMYGTPAKLPCFTYGKSGIVVAVVPFNASTSTGTQDITSTKLAGTTCRLAIFSGSGATSYDTVTANVRQFFGATDGTDQFLKSNYVTDGSEASGTTGSLTGGCAGFYDNAGGAAVFDSWITNGVRIDWVQGAPSAYKCWALLIGSPTEEGFKAKVGVWQSESTFDIDDTLFVSLGWRPKTILDHPGRLPHVQCGLGWSYLDESGNIHQKGRGSDWDVGYFDTCGGWILNATEGIHGYRATQGSSDTYRWKIDQYVDTGFVLKCIAGGTSTDYGGYIAMTFEDDFEVNGIWDVGVTAGSNRFYKTNNKPLAVLVNETTECNSSYPYCDECDSNGFMAFDDINQEACIFCMGTDTDFPENNWVAKSITSQSALLRYTRGTTPSVQYKASRVSMDNNGFTLNYSTGSGTNYFTGVVFAEAKKLYGELKCFLSGHDYRQDAFVHGSLDSTSSIPLFLNVFDAQDEKSCYTEGLAPLRSDISCYAYGADSAMVVICPFTTTNSSTQDITTTDLCGLTPKGAICLIQYNDNDTFTEGHWAFGIGFTDGTNQYYGCMTSSNDTSHPYTWGWRRGYPSYGFCVMPTSTGAVTLKGTFNQWLTNGVRVNWTTINTGRKGVMIFFAGSDMDVDVGTLTRNPGGTTATTQPGFMPDFVFYVDRGGASSEESDYASALMKSQSLRWAFCVNDGSRGGWNSSFGVWSGDQWATNCLPSGSQAASFSSNCIQIFYVENQYENYYTTIDSYDASGFTVEWGSQVSTGSDVYFAVNFGGKLKAVYDLFTLDIDDYGNTDYKVSLTNKNIDPLFALMMMGQNRIVDAVTKNGCYIELGNDRDNANLGGYGYLDSNGPNFIFMGNKFVNLAVFGQGRYIDCSYYYSDHYTADYYSLTTIKAYQSSWYPVEEQSWTQHFQATFVSLIENGVRLNVSLNQDKKYEESEYTEWKLPLLLFGTLSTSNSQACYAHGKKVWIGRLPRGAYLNGAIAGTSADSSIPCYCDCTGIPADSNTDAYTHGATDISSGSLVECYLRGSQDDSSQFPCFTVAVTPAESSIPCYLRNGWDDSASMYMFLQGDLFRGNTPCYCEGYPTVPQAVNPAFIKGEGFFPFTDDFTGNDEDPWSIKWITGEQG